MRIGGVVVRVRPGSVDTVAERLKTMGDVLIAHRTEDGLALVLEGASPAEQEASHRLIAGWPEVDEASVVFQSSEV
jgi:nitrate reductase NapAB chaperone NapD